MLPFRKKISYFMFFMHQFAKIPFSRNNLASAKHLFTLDPNYLTHRSNNNKNVLQDIILYKNYLSPIN